LNHTSIAKPPTTAALDEHQSKQLLRQYGIPVVEDHLVADADQAIKTAEQLGYPVVLKGIGAALMHKTEAGLVHLHINGREGVRAAVRSLKSVAGDALEGILVQPQVSGQREFMAGLFRDPLFGPVVLFGLGGTLAEALDDTAMAVAPLSTAEALEMAGQIRAQKLLQPFRGERQVDMEVLTRILTGLSRLAEDHPEVSEVDINPLKISSRGDICAVDALVLREPSDPPATAPEPVAPASIGRLFYPRAMAFVGASAKLGKWGHMLTVNTIGGGYGGDVYLVNPGGGRILGRRVYRTIGDIPHRIDLAVVTIPADKVLGLIPECQAKGVRYMVLITSGFSETGPAGKRLEQRLIAAAREADMLILGPNTMGFANPHIALFCTGSAVTPLAGGTAMVSQSGNMGTQLLAFAERQGIGIRGFAGSGNEAMVTVEDFLEGFESDTLTHTVILYVESIKNGRRFFESARRVSRKKPVILLKGGQTQAGHKAAASHTGALMSDHRVFNAMCRQSGIIKVEQPMELLDLAAAFSSLPLPKGPRVAIMTLGGGWGVVTADLCHHHHLQVPDLDSAIIGDLDQLLPAYWSRANPVDLVGEQDPQLPVKALDALAAWEGCDAVINLGILGRRIFLERLGRAALDSDPDMDAATLNQMRTLLQEFESHYIQHAVALMERYEKPIIGVHLLTDGLDQTLYRVEASRFKGVFYETPERAVYALSKMVSYQKYLSR